MHESYSDVGYSDAMHQLRMLIHERNLLLLHLARRADTAAQTSKALAPCAFGVDDAEILLHQVRLLTAEINAAMDLVNELAGVVQLPGAKWKEIDDP